jgi:molybdate transport system substrate-binding protein
MGQARRSRMDIAGPFHRKGRGMIDEVMHALRIAISAVALMAATHAGGTADAAEIRVLSSGSMKAALSQLLPDFEKSSGDTATIEYGPAGAIVGRVQKDDAADVVIVSRSQLQKLEGNGKVVQGSLVNIAGIALGVAVRKGAPKPDIGNVEAFKRALLSARSIGYRDPTTGSTSGIYTASLLERLGIAQDLKPKLNLDRSEGDVPENVFLGVANGDVEMQIGQITEIVIAPGVDLAGPLPPEIQNTTVMAAGITTTSKAPDAAKALVSFISSPSAAAVLKASGFQPVNAN